MCQSFSLFDLSSRFVYLNHFRMKLVMLCAPLDELGLLVAQIPEAPGPQAQND